MVWTKDKIWYEELLDKLARSFFRVRIGGFNGKNI